MRRLNHPFHQRRALPIGAEVPSAGAYGAKTAPLLLGRPHRCYSRARGSASGRARYLERCKLDWAEFDAHGEHMCLHRDLVRLRREDAVLVPIRRPGDDAGPPSADR